MTTKLCKTETAPREKKLFSLKDGNWTNLRFADRASELTCKKADNSLTKERPLEKLVS